MKILEQNPRFTKGINWASCKFKNTRCTVVKRKEGGVWIENRIVSDDLSPRAVHRVLKGRCVVTAVAHSEKGAEALLLNLAELLGYDLYKKNEKVQN